MPFSCQILRGTTGEQQGLTTGRSKLEPTRPQVSSASAAKKPQLPKLMSLQGFEIGRSYDEAYRRLRR